MSAQHYLLVESALHYLDQHREQQPSLSEIAAHIGLSDFHFQRLFTDWAGVSPKRFLQFLNREYLKTRLDSNASVLDATLESGLSGTSRSHELFVSTEGITPAQYRDRGKNLVLHYGIHDSPFGEYLLATAGDSICHMAFITEARELTVRQFMDDWELAQRHFDPARTAGFHQRIFAEKSRPGPLPLLLRGSPFQLKVWEALLGLPAGEVLAYEDLAARTGQPAATRAAASAIARNRIALLIPCHRVIRKIGESGEYRWGKARKRLMLAREAAQTEMLRKQ